MAVDGLNVEARQRQGAGYGLYAIQQIPPSTPLFTIPTSALLNILTLLPHYPSTKPPLTAVQLMSLHLMLHRPKGDKVSSDPHFGPYISVLPEGFESHPLTWLRKQGQGLPACAQEAGLLASLPPSVKESLNELSIKFEADWKRVSDYLHDNSHMLEHLHDTCPDAVDKEAQFLWGWLNVNTRCIYQRVRESRADPDNISLCPILDFANHIPNGPHMLPCSNSINGCQLSSLQRRRGDVSLVSPERLTAKGDEMYLVYGAHPNKTLFVEYGFVNRVSAEILDAGLVSGEVDVRVYVEDLFEQRGQVGEWMKEVLKEEGYWGDWSMYSSPAPACPSFRLIAALRLYHVLPLTATRLPSTVEVFIQPWKETLFGTREYISKENERLWRESLVGMCKRLEGEAGIGVRRVRERGVGECEEWVKGGRECVEQMWFEQLHVAGEVKKSVEDGQEF
ncbi:hypothetical protein AX17_003286 [Amanita inopinata Kibby_2008]|nr:hypothetical protein AX17_003286 [Amanita inopinata Kibby_2008]